VADEIEAMEREAALEKSSKKFSVLDIVRNKGNCAFFVAWGGASAHKNTQRFEFYRFLSILQISCECRKRQFEIK